MKGLIYMHGHGMVHGDIKGVRPRKLAYNLLLNRIHPLG